MNKAIKDFISKDVLERFCRYCKVYTTSDPGSTRTPSTERQLDLLRILEAELRALGLTNVEIDQNSFLYATLPANVKAAESFGLLAHVDTSPDQPGENVKPRLIENWSGEPISFPDDPALMLDQKLSPELSKFLGDTIITASGKTLLGADDKAGVAEIMSALATFRKFSELQHGEITVCFTHDEEIGRGVEKIDLRRMPKFCYTMDGGEPGELEDECFDAWRAKISIKGVGVHPGSAKDKLVNASVIAARYVAALPEWEAPEHTEKRDGFYYVMSIQGGHEHSVIELLLRDFDASKNQRRIKHLKDLAQLFESRYGGAQIAVEVVEQYKNMYSYLERHPEVIERARRAIAATGLTVIRKPIRGGTDGSKLSEMGHPTPNIFAGGLLFHSRTEWIAHSALCKAAETIIYLAKEWSAK